MLCPILPPKSDIIGNLCIISTVNPTQYYSYLADIMTLLIVTYTTSTGADISTLCIYFGKQFLH